MSAILILGEHDKGHGEPFSTKTVSGRRLRQLVSGLALDADLGNVFSFAEGKCVERNLSDVCHPYRSVVAVGRVASAECSRQGIRHTYLPHPAVRSASQLTQLRTGLELLKENGRLDYPEHQANRKDVEPGVALPCASISADNPRADHGSQGGGNRGTVAEAGRSPTHVVEFYRANDKPYGAFSNLYRREIEINGAKFPTNEHAYQFLKPRDPRVRDWLMAAPAPSLVALAAHAMLDGEADPTEIMGRTADALLGFHIRSGWSLLRYPWMMTCIRAKYSTQHPDLCDLLLGTDDCLIVEAGKIDDDAGRRWGRVNGRGNNYLGRMLMRRRAELGGVAFPDDDLDMRLAGGAEALRTALGAAP